MKKKVFNIIQIGDKSNRLSRLFDIFIAIVICANILVTFLQTFDELAFLFPIFHVVEVLTILIFCVEYILRIWTADIPKGRKHIFIRCYWRMGDLSEHRCGE